MGHVSTKEAAERLGVDESRVRVFLRDGRLRGQKIGRDWVIDERSIEAFAKVERPTGRPGKPTN